MSAISNVSLAGTSSREASKQASVVSPAVVFAGRLLFSLLFLMTTATHFNGKLVGYAAAAGVPLASIAVPLSGVVAIAGGLSILLGYRARIGAWLLVIFLVPVTLMMHNFWAVKDPMMAQMQMVMFNEEPVYAGRRFVDFAVWLRTVEPRRAARALTSSLISSCRGVGLKAA